MHYVSAIILCNLLESCKISLLSSHKLQLLILSFSISRLRASEERQFCPWKNVALQITKISNPIQSQDYRWSCVSQGDFPSPAVKLPSVLTPPPTVRGQKGKTRSKRTVPKPDKRENQETFSFHTPPESPEDCSEVTCHHGNSEMMSDADDDVEDEEMQDYRLGGVRTSFVEEKFIITFPCASFFKPLTLNLVLVFYI